ncbi:MAG: hypothetical protein WC426_11005 [Sulfuriferula sp.]
MRRVLFSSLLFYTNFIFLFMHAAYAAEPTLCKADETIILSCPVEGNKGKIISMCAKNAGNGKNPSYIEYRFGTKKNTEMTYLVTKNNGAKIYRGLYDGTYSIFFGFKIKDYFYIAEVPQEVKRAHMNIIIRKNTERIATILCKVNSWEENKDIKTTLLTDVDGEALMEGEIEPEK